MKEKIINQNNEIVKVYKKKRNNEIVNLSNDFAKFYIYDKKNVINGDFLNTPILSIKIIMKILDVISYDQFRPQNKNQVKQMRLFEKEFMTDDNLTASFVFDIKDFNKKKNQYSYKIWEKALAFLANYKKDYYVTVNSQGKRIKTYSGLISNHSISEGKVNFLIYNFWLEKLLNISDYTTVLFNLVNNIKNPKYFEFYLFLHSLKKSGGTIKSLSGFNEKYNLNYKSAKEFCKSFLKPIKTLFDKYSDISFNYSYKGNNIHIVVYLNDLKTKEISKETVEKQKIKQKIYYLKKRYKLSDVNVKKLKKIFNTAYKYSPNDVYHLFEAYNLMVKSFRKQKRSLVDESGEDGNEFMKIYDSYIEHYFDKLNDRFFRNKKISGRPKLID